MRLLSICCVFMNMHFMLWELICTLVILIHITPRMLCCHHVLEHAKPNLFTTCYDLLNTHQQVCRPSRHRPPGLMSWILETIITWCTANLSIYRISTMQISYPICHGFYCQCLGLPLDDFSHIHSG